MVEKNNGISEIGSKMDQFILAYNILPSRRDNMVQRMAFRKFSMGLASSPVDSYSIESMKDILRINLWRSENVDKLYLLYSTCESASFAEVLLLIKYAEHNDMYSAITARLIGRSLSRPMVKKICEVAPLKEPLAAYLKLEGIEQTDKKPTIFSLMPSNFCLVDSDDDVFE